MQSILSNIIGSLVLSIGSIYYARIALKDEEKIYKPKYILSIILLTTVYTIVFLNCEGGIRSIINFIVYVAVYRRLFNISVSKAILLTFIYSIILIVPEMITLFVASEILGISKHFIYTEFAGSLQCNTIICSGFALLIFIGQKHLQKLFSYKLESSIVNVIYSIGTFTCVVVVFYKIIEELQEITHFDTLILVIMIIVFITILMSYYKAKISKQKTVAKYDKMLEFIKIYETEIETQRVNNHEIKNQFTTIKSMMLDGVSIEGIVAYIDEIYGDIRKINNQEYAKLTYLPANGIKGLLYFKIDEAKSKGINVSVNISSKITNSIITTLDIKEFKNLGKLLGVFIDNAIEASIKTPEKAIGIEMYTTGGGVEIIMSNTFSGTIDEKVGKEKYSTKGKHRGHGLLLANNIIEQNSIFEIHREIINVIYVQTLLIKEQKNQV